jgi:hypothetical protein
MYTEEQLMARLKFFIGICLALTLTGIIFVILYSIIFITQPLNAISPIDQKFFEMIIPIATFLTGTLSGIMLAGGDKDLRAKALEAANKPAPQSPTFPTGLSLTSTPATIYNSGVPSSTSLVTPSSVPNPIVAQPIVGFNGKLAPPAAPQPPI